MPDTPSAPTLQSLFRDYVAYLREEGVTSVPASSHPPPPPKPRRAKTPAPPAPTTPEPTISAPAAPPPPPPSDQPSAPVPMPTPAAEPPTSYATELPTTNAPGDTLDTIAAEIRACRACPLCQRRLNPVPGEGNPDHPDIMFIGEGPGADEDAQGRPFVGRSGQLLDKMIAAIGYERERVFIGNIVKCRPPGNRTPTPSEMAGCIPYLLRQIDLIRPRLIVCLGSTAMIGLLGNIGPISRVRGTWHDFHGIPVLPTFHPAYLLRDPSRKRFAWADLKTVMARLSPPT